MLSGNNPEPIGGLGAPTEVVVLPPHPTWSAYGKLENKDAG